MTQSAAYVIFALSTRLEVLFSETFRLSQVFNYFLSLFPIIGWIGRYNLGWLTGDVIAGLTVGERSTTFLFDFYSNR